MLYFTAIINQDPKNYLLLSGNFINKKRVSGKKSMKRQEMLVLEDFNEYISTYPRNNYHTLKSQSNAIRFVYKNCYNKR